jgi:hypothetical protein
VRGSSAREVLAAEVAVLVAGAGALEVLVELELALELVPLLVLRSGSWVRVGALLPLPLLDDPEDGFCALPVSEPLLEPPPPPLLEPELEPPNGSWY